MPHCADRLSGAGDGWHWLPKVGDLVCVTCCEPYLRELSSWDGTARRMDLTDFVWASDSAKVRLSTGEWVHFTTSDSSRPRVLKVERA